ncbi:MerR family transcriptional regulator [Pandoraea apista]|uniref:MerR family transcriptional regulator n=1 Tax=Pandoraea apista TaxID=93218 RepID=UPI000F678493|nr:MerR family transcriptional regulator [Pandoraea apista]RSD10956.1 MerR family transcriptional regulator [Pandoraea apista]RSK78613.1 MerR family transcriptional regulator [Pandoraea apista]
MEARVSSVRRYRSGEAAKLVDMPAATLRIWEQRYSVISPATSASGQRQYSDLDVGRLRTIKSLVDKGHAIGAIAHLDNEQLSRLASGAGAPPFAKRTTFCEPDHCGFRRKRETGNAGGHYMPYVQ